MPVISSLEEQMEWLRLIKDHIAASLKYFAGRIWT